MIDITKEMLDLKEATRHIWNSYVQGRGLDLSSEVFMCYSDIERALMRIIVLEKFNLGEISDLYGSKVIKRIRVVPKFEEQEVNIMFGCNIPGNGYTFEATKTVGAKDIPIMYFHNFFDWDSYGHVDMALVRVGIAPLKSEYLSDNRIALIEQKECRFFLDQG